MFIKYVTKLYLIIKFHGTKNYPLPVLPCNEQDLANENIVNTYSVLETRLPMQKSHDTLVSDISKTGVSIKLLSNFWQRHGKKLIMKQLWSKAPGRNVWFKHLLFSIVSHWCCVSNHSGRSFRSLNGEGLRYGWDWVVPQASLQCDLQYRVISQ